ncbi:hypothetical protein Tsubulata_029612 [Turnera subulata]|uniref:Glucosidase 2 subunit beta n=1 Tax=Turnera subulata TaxID=218843 RepID=A0A9Q0FUQ7_9ROSI|nr:hypothetical protein Tsubulata_029612 [Turnera subulata]
MRVGGSSSRSSRSRSRSCSSSSCSLIVIVVIGVICGIAGVGRSSAAPKNPFLGIPPQDEDYYKPSSSSSGTIIKCRDGSGSFTPSQLNDDFCDCPDGTDEPGTSACPSARFYCRNAGHIPLSIFSSRVNDGICDCCDGSDEYDGQATCPNTCWEAGKVARDKLKKKIDTYKQGVTLRRKDVEQAKSAIAKVEAELTKLKHEESILKPLVQQLKDRKEQIDKAEEKERLQKEKEEKERKEAEEKANTEASKAEDKANPESELLEDTTGSEDAHTEIIDHDKIGALDDSPKDQEIVEDYADLGAEAETKESSKDAGSPSSIDGEKQATDDEESVSQKGKDEPAVVSDTVQDTGSAESPDKATTQDLSREELGRLVASRWTGNSEKQTEEIVDTKESEQHEEVSQYAHDDEDDGYASETDDDTGKYDDDTGKYDDVDAEDNDDSYEEHSHDDESPSYKSDTDGEVDLSDTTSLDNLSWLEKIQRSVRNIIQAVSFFQTPVNKSEAATVRKEYEESSTKLSKIQSRISSLTQKLKHDYGSEKEFYAFYDQCFESKQNKYVYKVCPFKQASQVEGHSTTRLGRFERFEDSYRTMIFSSGDRCWNGPDRSLKVKLRCGLKNELTDVDEPSRCEYVAFLATPAVCLEEKLKELEGKLELMSKEQPQSHDEL